MLNYSYLLFQYFCQIYNLAQGQDIQVLEQCKLLQQVQINIVTGDDRFIERCYSVSMEENIK